MKAQSGIGRRGFLRSGAAALGASFWADETLDAAVQNVNRNSHPSDLKITDLRVAVVKGAPMTCPLIRIDTNQDIYGLGEVRDGASKTYALILKSRILGENPCNIDKIFRKIKQFGGDSRQAGGVCGIEMALWDLAGKAYGVPVYQMLGGKFRDKIRCYADTTESNDAKIYGQRLKARRDEGFTWLKMDLGIDLLHGTPGTLTHPLGLTERDVFNTQHMFTGIQLTDKGIGMMGDFVATVREYVGMEVPLSADHFGHIDVNSCIRLGKGLEKYNMAWLEDMIPWQPARTSISRSTSSNWPATTLWIFCTPISRPRAVSSKPRKSATPSRNMGSAWPCISPGRRFPAWRMSTARRLPRISWRSKTTPSTCPGGAIWWRASKSPSSIKASSPCPRSPVWESR